MTHSHKKLVYDKSKSFNYPKRMRIVIELDCDNTSAMFNRERFNDSVKQIIMNNFYNVKYIETEEA